MSDYTKTSDCERVTVYSSLHGYYIEHTLSGAIRPIGDIRPEDSELESGAIVDDYIEAYFGSLLPLPSHYIVKAGLKGCLPNYLEVAATLEDAVEVLWDVHPTIGRRRRAILKKELYLDLHLHPCFAIPDGDGNEYCQIVKCDCDTPWNHGDEGPASICEYLRGEWEYETT